MKVLELLTDKTKWTKRAYARNQDGESCSSRHSEAVCWCLSGAINACYPYNDAARYEAQKKVEAAIATLCGFESADQSIPMFNDVIANGFSDIKRVLEIADV